MTDLDQLLHELTLDQPVQPADRADRVQAKARRIRRTRAGAALAALVLVAAPVGAVALHSHIGGPSDGASVAPAAGGHEAAGWPDRSAAYDQGVAAGAVPAYNLSENQSVDARDIHWLYRGDVAQPDGRSTTYVAVFTTEVFQQLRLVVAHVGRDQVDAQGKGLDEGIGLDAEKVGGTPWVVTSMPLADGQLPDQVSLYLPYSVTGMPGRFSDVADQLFVLADPSARRLTWRQQPLPAATQSVQLATPPTTDGTASSGNGVFVADAGALLGPVTITTATSDGDELGSSPVTAGLSEIILAQPRPPDVPPGFVELFGSNGTFTTEGGHSYQLGKNGSSIYIRCYGGGQLSIKTPDSPAGTSSLPGTVLPCDGSSHRAATTTAGQVVSVTADRLSSFALVGGSP